jgi:zona occludens toxin (predicted ATPase)
MARIPKTALYTAISVIVLLVLLVGGGIAYVWYTGQNAPDISGIDAAPAAAESPAVLTPTKPAANANASASVQVLTSPVAPGDNASISIKTVATSTCTIKVMYGDVQSTDSGLTTKTADEFGIVSWAWTVGATVPTGTWPVTVTCNYNGRSAVVQGNLVVAR